MPGVTQHEGTKSDFNPKADHKVSQPKPESSLSSCPPSAVKSVTPWGPFPESLPALCPAQLGAGAGSVCGHLNAQWEAGGRRATEGVFNDTQLTGNLTAPLKSGDVNVHQGRT